MQHRHLRTLLRRLPQPLGDQRLVLAQEAADHEHAIERVDLGDLHAQPRNAGALRGEIGLPQPEVDVVAAERAHEARGQRLFLERRMRRHQRADGVGAMLRDDVGKPVRDMIESRLPVDRLPFAALLDHRRRQPFARIERFV